jgi:hypothetical protein
VTGPADPTLGEVARRLDDVLSRFEKLAGDLPRTFVSRDLFDSYKETTAAKNDLMESEHRDLARRINELEDDKKWLYRLIVGAVILAIVSIAFTAGRAAVASPSEKPPSSTSSSTGSGASP